MFVVQAKNVKPIERNLVGKLEEGSLDISYALIVLQVFSINIGNYCNSRGKLQKGTITLICLGNQKISGA